MSPEASRTFHASQALELSELVNMRFARLRYGSADPMVVRMREPDGPSTDAGRKARHPLLLQRHFDDETGLVFGFVDLFKRTADIKGYPLLKQQHEQRFGETFTMSSSEYGRLVDEMRAFLQGHSIETRLVNVTRSPSHVPSPQVRRRSTARPPVPVVPMVLSAAIGFALCYTLFALELLKL